LSEAFSVFVALLYDAAALWRSLARKFLENEDPSIKHAQANDKDDLLATTGILVDPAE
jgi:hypothetical protein